MTVRTICCVGSTDTGILTCFVIALKCPEIRVIILDKPEVICDWNSDVLPICDSEVEEIVRKCRNRNLFFNSDYPTAFRTSEIIFISIKGVIKNGRNPGDRKCLDLKQVEDVARKITTYADSNKVVVEKSSTPAQAAERVALIVQSTCEPGIKIDVLCNPEFLREGSVVQSLLNPEMVLIGCAKTPSGKAAAQVLSSVYERWIPQKNISFISMPAAEELKLAATALLLQQAATAMVVTRICNETGADSKDIRRFVGLDAVRKLYGNVRHLTLVCECLKIPEIADYWESVRDRHRVQESTFFDRFKPMQGQLIAILGISRDAVSKCDDPTPMDTCKWLLSEKATVNVYDPKMHKKQLAGILNLDNVDDPDTSFNVYEDVYKAVEGVSILISYGYFSEYADISFQKIFKLMAPPKAFLSGLKLLEEDEHLLKRIGFQFDNLWEEEK